MTTLGGVFGVVTGQVVVSALCAVRFGVTVSAVSVAPTTTAAASTAAAPNNLLLRTSPPKNHLTEHRRIDPAHWAPCRNAAAPLVVRTPTRAALLPHLRFSQPPSRTGRAPTG